MGNVSGCWARPWIRQVLGLAMWLIVAACRFDLPPLPSGDAGEPPLELEVLAGNIGGPGNLEGAGAAARFSTPSGVAVDSAGNVYVADYYNQTIRKVTAGGVVTTLAGSARARGSTDGTGAVARFDSPSGVAVDSTGNIYVADMSNSTIRRVSPEGTTTTIAGRVRMTGIVPGASPLFAFPGSLAISGDSLVISDTNAILLLRHGAR
jgi:hypothetical protein